jgi:hypothetical protein
MDAEGAIDSAPIEADGAVDAAALGAVVAAAKLGDVVAALPVQAAATLPARTSPPRARLNVNLFNS